MTVALRQRCAFWRRTGRVIRHAVVRCFIVRYRRYIVRNFGFDRLGSRYFPGRVPRHVAQHLQRKLLGPDIDLPHAYVAHQRGTHCTRHLVGRQHARCKRFSPSSRAVHRSDSLWSDTVNDSARRLTSSVLCMHAAQCASLFDQVRCGSGRTVRTQRRTSSLPGAEHAVSNRRRRLNTHSAHYHYTLYQI